MSMAETGVCEREAAKSGRTASEAAVGVGLIRVSSGIFLYHVLLRVVEDSG